MKQDKKAADKPRASQAASDNQPQQRRIHLTLVTEEEREKYRVPSYRYIL